MRISMNAYTIQSLNIALVITIVCIVNYYFSFSHEAWMILAAWLVSQTTRGTPVRQAVLIFIIMLVAVFISSWMLITIKQREVIYIISATPLIVSGSVVYFNRPQANTPLLFAFIFSFLLLFSALSPIESFDFMHDRIIDISIGALIGILSKWFSPNRLDKEFSQGVTTVLRSFKQYSQTFADNLLSFNAKNGVQLEKIQIEVALQDQPAMYPEWVYEVGFNRGLRSGFRFFLISIERIAEIFFSMNFIASRDIDSVLLNDIYADLTLAMQKNTELLTILIEYFENHKLMDVQSDFTSDMTALENTLNRIIPGNLELLDISPSYLQLTALVRDIRDLRTLLLQLVMALPVAAATY